MMLTASLLLIWTGCKTKLVVISADRTVAYLDAGKSFTASNGPVYIVGPARMQEILYQLRGITNK